MIEAIKKNYIKNGIVRPVNTFPQDEKGKVIYEVIRINKGKPLFYEKHYQRFINSIKLSSSDFAITQQWLRKNIQKLIDENKLVSENIKITYNLESRDLSVFVINHKYPTLKLYSEGVDTSLFFGERQNPSAKVVNKEFREAVNKEIKLREVYEAILVNRNGLVTEGSKSNIFMIKDDILYTSKLENVLNGVTRTEIINIARENNIEVVEKDINYLELPLYDAMFISGTSPNILPIKTVDEHEYNTKNTLLRELMKQFKIKIKEYIEEN